MGQTNDDFAAVNLALVGLIATHGEPCGKGELCQAIEGGRAALTILDSLRAELAAVKAERDAAVERCVEIAMARCRALNGDAVAQIRAGRPEMASLTEMKADQCEWIANAILRECRAAAIVAAKEEK